MKTIYAENKIALHLGREGENLARQVVFDLSDWLNAYGAGTAQLLVQRSGDERPYIREITQEGNTATWVITLWETENASHSGKCELRWYVGKTLVKSRTWSTQVDAALETPSEETPPDPEQGWVDQVLDAAARAEAAADRAENAAGGGGSGGDDSGGSSGGGLSYKIGTGLKITDGDTLEVDSATDFNGDNDRPASAALVKAQLGNIEAFLATI